MAKFIELRDVRNGEVYIINTEYIVFFKEIEYQGNRVTQIALANPAAGGISILVSNEELGSFHGRVVK